MNSRVCVFGDKLCFNVNNDLEKYRVESALEKEPETIAWINDWLITDKSAIFLDIGANIGIFSLYVAYRYSNIDVYSFEPVSNNFNALQNNLRINKFKNIYPFNLALSNINKLTNLYLSDIRAGNSGAQIGMPINEKGEKYVALRTEKVISFSLDEIISQFKFPVPNFIKIDVDGHEDKILEGMIQTLSLPETIRSLLVEFNNSKEFKKWMPRLLEIGFNVDGRFDQVPNHSRFRRMKNSNPARNYIFSRL